jgi:hypothetical protein
MKVLGAIFLCCVAYVAEARPDGAPTTACSEMSPFHGPSDPYLHPTISRLRPLMIPDMEVSLKKYPF